ncbi:MAG TPA: hypothetical protein VMJ93_16625 [Verrucomicrobiae bacterium]|nr:hypothetical protein [Verrucomicrobiae bacterium]
MSSCGGGTNGGGTPKPITLFLTVSPPATLPVNGTTQIAVTVLNDPLHRGVTWSCAPLNTCGTFTPVGTASGASTTYTAPPTRGSVTITAMLSENSQVTLNAYITITSPISVSITEPPPQTMQANTSASLAATITNDTANAGLNWTCSPSATCGSFSPAHTASGGVTVYTAPSTAGGVTITATSATDATAYATASLNVFTVIGVGNLSGNYAFYLSGQDKNKHPYALAGAVLLDGSGGVTGGEQDSNNGSGTISPEPGGDTITGGSYTLGPDGQGTLTLITNNAGLGVGGTETLALSRVNDQHVLITEFDGASTASGSLDYQKFFANTIGQIAGGFSFLLSGGANGGALVEGGVFTSDGGGNLKSVVMDQNAAGVVTFGTQYLGTYEAPDAYGRGRVTFGGLNFSYYVIGVEALRMIETDSSRAAVGSAFGQGPLSGTASAASLNGNYVFTDSSGAVGAAFGAAGMMSSNSRGKITGFADVNESQGTVSSAAFTANYTLGSNGYGRIILNSGGTQDVLTLGVYVTDPQLNLYDPNNINGGGGALLADLDTKAVGIGAAVPQVTGSSVKGNFAAGFQGQPAAGEEDFVGAGSTAPNAPLSGTGSWNQLFGVGQATDVPFSVALTADPAHAGRYTAVVQFNNGAVTNNFAVYLATGQLAVGAQVDAQQPGLGVLQQQQ